MTTAESMIGQLATVDAVWAYILAGNATFTLVSKKTGERFTYKVRKAERKAGDIKDMFFVNLMNGPDNENDFCYMGILTSPAGTKKYIFDDALIFKMTPKSAVKPEAPSAKAFNWFYRAISERNELPATVEIWHTGRCGRCGRKLTVPSSVALGIGPDCAEKM